MLDLSRIRVPPCHGQTVLQNALALFAASNTDGLVYGRDKDFSVANLSGPRSGGNGLYNLPHAGVGDNHVQLYFGKKIYLVFVTPIGFRVTLLPSVPSHIGDGNSVYANAAQGVFYFIQLVRLNDGLDSFHGFTVLCRKKLSCLCCRRAKSA